MPSIRQSAYLDVLPDFRNVGIIARVLLGVNAAVLAGVIFAEPSLAQALERFVQAAALLEPLLLVVTVLLFIVSPALRRLSYPTGCATLLGLVALIVAVYLGTIEASAGRRASYCSP